LVARQGCGADTNQSGDDQNSNICLRNSGVTVTHVHLNVGGNVKFGAGDWIPGTGMMREFAWYRGMGLIDFV
jgi:hypothetical protein